MLLKPTSEIVIWESRPPIYKPKSELHLTHKIIVGNGVLTVPGPVILSIKYTVIHWHRLHYIHILKIHILNPDTYKNKPHPG
jgi:hypothetical protein